MRIRDWIDRRFYSSFEGNWDNKRFRTVVEAHIEPRFTVLDYGAGRGALEEMNFKNRAKTVAGVDPNDEIRQNPYLDEAKLLPLPDGIIPYPDESFDLVTAGQCWVWFDHDRALAEVQRMLRPGGHLVVAHYCYLPRVSAIARRSEELVLEHNPSWTMAGWDGVYATQIDAMQQALTEAGNSGAGGFFALAQGLGVGVIGCGLLWA